MVCDATPIDLVNRFAAFLLVVLVSASVIASCAARGPAIVVDDELALATRVESRLQVDPDLRPFGLTVAAYEGTVVLRGRVEDELDRTKAELLTRDTPGVEQVINDIDLATPPHQVDSPFRDAWVATRVKARLVAHPDLDASGLSVEARQGVVVLSGRVTDPRHREGAEVLARTTQGVVNVVNRVEVAPRG